MQNDTDLQDALKAWDAGKPVRVFTIPTSLDQVAIWNFTFTLLAEALPGSADPLVLDPQDEWTAREIVKAVKGHGWRKTLQIHMSHDMPAIEITNPARQDPPPADQAAA